MNDPKVAAIECSPGKLSKGDGGTMDNRETEWKTKILKRTMISFARMHSLIGRLEITGVTKKVQGERFAEMIASGSESRWEPIKAWIGEGEEVLRRTLSGTVQWEWKNGIHLIIKVPASVKIAKTILGEKEGDKK